MITTKQRSYLKSLAHNLSPIFQVGKNGVVENTIIQFNEAFETKEIIKATVLNNSLLSAKEACEEISKKTQSEIVLVIGNRFVLYKASKKNPQINLPKK
ncbi:MAG: ribosome assembly RNA-binding protein YhbY [Clostridiales bacterium]|nr:ribosome assembly RNA-binding protein YhbY [Clostridiales bacterium]